MFLDEKKEGEASGPSLNGFILFLETKDPQEKYDWRVYQRCAVGAYAATLGISAMGCIGDPVLKSLSSHIAKGRGGKFPQDWTFGGCLDRARTFKTA